MPKEDYVKSLQAIVSKIKKLQSAREPQEKIQSFGNFLEEIDILERKYKTYKGAKTELKNFDPADEKPPKDFSFTDLCAELQYNLVESAREFHLQIYSATSSLMKFLSTFISKEGLGDIETNSVSKFYISMKKHSGLINEVQNLERSYEFRVFITHPTLCKNYDWMTFNSEIIYFHKSDTLLPKEKQKQLENCLKHEKLAKFVPHLEADDFRCPPEPDITYEAFLRITKNIIRKFKDN